MAKIYNITSEITNLNNLIQLRYQAEDDFDIITESWFPDLETVDDLDDILNGITENEISPDDYNSDEDYEDACLEYWSDGVMQLERIDKNSNLYYWLRSWYDSVKPTDTDLDEYMQAHIHGYYETDNAIYYCHGIGYDALDDDLLNGNGDGTNHQAFINFLN